MKPLTHSSSALVTLLSLTIHGRGQNENANGLLRKYFPKSMILVDIAYEEVRLAVHKVNTRPRKCLGFKTPYEVFFENTGVDVSKLEMVHL